MANQLQDYYYCLSSALDVLIGAFDSLNLKFGGVTINLWFLVGSAVVLMIYHYLMGVDLSEDEYDGFSYHDDEEY